MLREFAAATSHLAWPILAFLLFFTTFVTAVIRVMRAPHGAIRELERLPLADQGDAHE